MQLTESLNPEIAREHLVDGEVVRYPSFDGLEIPAILYRPHQATAAARVPALVWVTAAPAARAARATGRRSSIS